MTAGERARSGKAPATRSAAPPLRPHAGVREVLAGLGAQAKLTVGSAQDAHEAEADRVADQVMRMPAPAAADPGPPPGSNGSASSPRLQRACAQCGKDHEHPDISPVGGTPPAQRLCSECEEEMQRKPSTNAGPSVQRAASGVPGSGGAPVSSSTEASIRSLRHGGRPLPASERAFFEPRFGRSFEHVRVHDGPTAERAARAISARAFTLGSDIAFARGEYAPGTAAGRRLMAHELTHTVQQDKGSTARRKPIPVHQAPGTQIQRAPVRGNPPTTIEEWLICLTMCFCDTFTPLADTLGRELRQQCVSQILAMVDASAGHQTTLKAEQSYDMTQNPPAPIMSTSNPLRPASRWGVYHYIKNNMPGFVKGTGMIRRPDVVITNNPLAPPTAGNTRKVVEIKFPGDVLTQAQRNAYIRIAGGAQNLSILTPGPESCNCDLMREIVQEALVLMLELILMAMLIAAIAADDVTGIGTADDVLALPILARMAILSERLIALVPRMSPVLVPLLKPHFQ